MFDIFVIGGGPAGLTAGIYGARAGYSVCIAEREFSGGQMANAAAVENYPGIPRVEGFELAVQMENHAKEAGAEIIAEEIIRIENNGATKNIVTAGGSSYQCKAVILCMGAARAAIGCPGENRLRGRGVSYCATCDGNFFKGKKVAVIGGGNTAFEDAIYLSRVCAEVYLIYRGDKPRSTKILQERIEAADNIKVLALSRVRSINGETSVQSITIDTPNGTEEIDVSGVFCAVGTVPRSELIRELADTDSKGYVIAGEDCRTSAEGIFVAGDLRAKPLKQIITAAADGACAAKAAAEYIESAVRAAV